MPTAPCAYTGGMSRAAAVAVSCLLSALPAVSRAAQWGGSATLSSDNLLRGVSRSANDPALSAELHVQFLQGAFAGIWASTSRVREQDDVSVELAGTIGYGGALDEDWSLRGTYTHYESPWAEFSDFYRYDEFTLDLRFRTMLLLSVSYSPNTSRYASAHGPVRDRKALAYEASYQRELPLRVRLHAGVGYYDLSDLFGEGYWYGSAGVGWTWQRWQLAAAYVATDDTAADLSYAEAAGDRALFSVSFVY